MSTDLGGLGLTNTQVLDGQSFPFIIIMLHNVYMNTL